MCNSVFVGIMFQSDQCVCGCVSPPYSAEPFRGKNIGLFGFKRKRSRKMIKNVSGCNFGYAKSCCYIDCVSCFQLSQYVAESKSVISRWSVNAPSLPPHLIKGSMAAKAERKAQRQMQFNVLNIPELGNSGWLA